MSRRSLTSLVIVCLAMAFPARSQWRSASVREIPGPVSAENDGTPSRKSVALAALYSLMLPGMGEWYAGDLSAGKYNLIAEGGLWLTYGGFKLQSGWIRDDARSYAGQHAGAQMSGKDANFEVNVGEYASVDAYNQAMLRNRAYDQVYSGASYQWQWQSDAQRLDYRGMRVRSDQANNNAKFAVAGLVINRIISAFSAARMVSRYNSGLAENRIELDVRPAQGISGTDGLELQVHAPF